MAEERLMSFEAIDGALHAAARLSLALVNSGLQCSIRVFGRGANPETMADSREAGWGVRVNVEQDQIDITRATGLAVLAEQFGFGITEFHAKHGLTFRFGGPDAKWDEPRGAREHVLARSAPPEDGGGPPSHLYRPFSEEALFRAVESYPITNPIVAVASDLEPEMMRIGERCVATDRPLAWKTDISLPPGTWDVRSGP